MAGATKLDKYIAYKFEKIYKYARPTIASGATPVEKADVKTPWFTVETKQWNTKSLSIRDDVWNKVVREAASEYKDPLYIVENASGNRLAIMDVEDFFDMLYELMEFRNNNK